MVQFTRLRTPLSPVIAMAVGFFLLPAVAMAQSGGLTGKSAVGAYKRPEPSAGQQSVKQPPALPGARPSGGAAPLQRLPSEMTPNEALFDAINRGDAGGARDAMNRGADSNARNVLGLSPIELAVDMSRNDIVFMLLSARTESGRGVRETAQTGARPARQAAGPVAPAPVTRRPVAEAGSAMPPRPAAAQARQAAHDGGTSNPSAGFLGFDAPRTGTAHP